MEILILNALLKKTKNYERIQMVLEENLQTENYSYEWIDVREMNVNTCIGTKCLACQFKTPGLCKQKDDMQDLYPKLIQAKLLVFLTPVSFGKIKGGRSSHLYKVFDFFTGTTNV
jgi:multimeric flavodoxin WrbA